MEHPISTHVLRRARKVTAVVFLGLCAVPGKVQVQRSSMPELWRAEKRVFTESGQGTYGILKSPVGQYLVPNVVERCVFLYSPEGNLIRRIPLAIENPQQVKGFAVDGFGNIVVGDGRQIRVFNLEGELKVEFTLEGKPGGKPRLRPYSSDKQDANPRPPLITSVAALRDGRIVAFDRSAEGLLALFAPDGRRLGSFGKAPPVDNRALEALFDNLILATDDADAIYCLFVSRTPLTIQKYSPEGQKLAEWYPSTPVLDKIAASARRDLEEQTKDLDPITETNAAGRTDRLFRAPLHFWGGAYDGMTGNFFAVASPGVLEMDGLGKVVRYRFVAGPAGTPAPMLFRWVLVEPGRILLASPQSGVYEFLRVSDGEDKE